MLVLFQFDFEQLKNDSKKNETSWYDNPNENLIMLTETNTLLQRNLKLKEVEYLDIKSKQNTENGQSMVWFIAFDSTTITGHGIVSNSISCIWNGQRRSKWIYIKHSTIYTKLQMSKLVPFEFE